MGKIYFELYKPDHDRLVALLNLQDEDLLYKFLLNYNELDVPQIQFEDKIYKNAYYGVSNMSLYLGPAYHKWEWIYCPYTNNVIQQGVESSVVQCVIGAILRFRHISSCKKWKISIAQIYCFLSDYAIMNVHKDLRFIAETVTDNYILNVVIEWKKRQQENFSNASKFGLNGI